MSYRMPQWGPKEAQEMAMEAKDTRAKDHKMWDRESKYKSWKGSHAYFTVIHVSVQFANATK